MKDIGNNCIKYLSYESEQEKEFDADEADYEDLWSENCRIIKNRGFSLERILR